MDKKDLDSMIADFLSRGGKVTKCEKFKKSEKIKYKNAFAEKLNKNK